MSHSSSLWMTPRNGDVNCEACTDRPPCMNHDLTFGANLDTYPKAINISRIALTEIISMTTTETPTTEMPTTETPTTETPNTETPTTEMPTTETPITVTMVTTQITATEIPIDQVLELIAEEESRLQDKVGDWSI